MNLIRASHSQNLLLENQVKLAEERLNASEESTSKLNGLLFKFAKNVTKYRESIEELAEALHEISKSEDSNESLKDFLDGASRTLASLADSRDQSTRFLEDEVFSSIQQYRAYCRTHRCRMKNICSSKEREASSRHRAAMIRRNISEGSDTQPLSHMQKALEDQTLSFEKKKLEVTRGVLGDFFKGETSFHADAIRLLSETCAKVLCIDVDSDFKAFQSSLLEKRKAPVVVRTSNAIVLRDRPHGVQDKFAFLDSESLRRLNDRRLSERSSPATVPPSETLCSADDLERDTDDCDDTNQHPNPKSVEWVYRRN